MLNIKKIVLSKRESFEFLNGGLIIFAEVDNENQLFRLRTTLFSETDYIPFSIRECVDKVFGLSLTKKFPAYLIIDEKEKKVDFIQEFYGGINIPLLKLLKLFTFAARSWAPILKKIARNDLLES
jgi:hypothetical protein